MSDHAGHSLLVAFDTDHPEFARGFELGRLWTLLRQAPEDEIVETVHVTSTEMIMRLAEGTGREVVGQELDDVWVTATFGAARDVEFHARG